MAVWEWVAFVVFAGVVAAVVYSSLRRATDAGGRGDPGREEGRPEGDRPREEVRRERALPHVDGWDAEGSGNGEADDGAVYCPSCGASNDRDFDYCRRCVTRLH